MSWRNKLDDVIRKYNLQAPVNLDKIIDDEKIILKKSFEEIENNGKIVWGVYIPKGYDEKTNHPIIIYSSEIKYYNSIRFTIAHELAHHFLEHEKIDISLREKIMNLDDGEREMNEFAINLLIPSKGYFIELLNKGYDNSRLANFYGVPLVSIEIFKRKNFL